MGEIAIGALPVYDLAPLEYRFALDAAVSVIGYRDDILVQCGQSILLPEVRNRIPPLQVSPPAGAGLWIEPQVGSWKDDLEAFQKLEPPATLAIIASMPLARFMEEWKVRRGETKALSIRIGGLSDLCRALLNAGFEIQSHYGIHTIQAIGLNFISRWASSLGYSALSDRLLFKARLKYCTTGMFKNLSTVALILARYKP